MFKRNEFLNMLYTNYDVSVINLEEKKLSFNFIYIFAFLRKYNFYEIHERLYSYKSALGNLGLDLENINKNQKIIKNDLVFIDIGRIKTTELNNIFYNNSYGKYLGLLVGSKPHQTNEIYQKLELYINKYFLDKYIVYDFNHFTLFKSFLDDFLEMGLHYILRTETLEGQILSLIIQKKSISNEKQLDNTNIYRIPFTPPYTDFVK